MKDVALSACEGIIANDTNLWMANASMAWLPGSVGILHQTQDSVNAILNVTDVHLGYSGAKSPLLAGIFAVNSDLHVDRFRMANSAAQVGIRFWGNGQGEVVNTQISNAAKGLDLTLASEPVLLVNSTIVNNDGPQLVGPTAPGSVTVYNSILWKQNATTDSWSGSCQFNNSQVQKAAGSIVPGSNNASTDPLFDTVNPINPYYHLSSASPCRDQGTTTAVTPFPTLDLFNQPRVVNGQVDRGALEYQ